MGIGGKTMARLTMMTIQSQKKIAHKIYEMILQCDEVSDIEAGQFLHIRLKNQTTPLRRPISVASVNRENQTCTIVYRVVGQGTLEMSHYEQGDTVDILGPLGHGFDTSMIHESSRVLIVGGGIGIAPLYELTKTVAWKNAQIDCRLGYANDKDIYYLEKFEALSTVSVSTDDGSYGIKGHVFTDYDDSVSYDVIYACGPGALNKAVQAKFKDHPHVYISLEERMACGIGACYGCETKDKKHRVCKEGPVFNAKEVQL